jgi:hypothetical protein
MGNGAADAARDVGQFVKKHPVASGAAAGGMLMASAICAHLLGLEAGATGVAIAQQLLQRQMH